jgi:hypothetical protein
MMKWVKIIAGGILIICWPYCQGQAQKKFSADGGEVRFTSNAQLEVIQASSSQLKGIIDSSTNQFAFRVNVVSFQGFNSSLQRDHFNENYLETEKYPTASFTGKIIEQIDWSADGTYEVRAKGELDIHGQKQTRIIKSKVTIRNGKVDVESSFVIPLADHNISIPRIVNQKIATEIEIRIKIPMTAAQ